MKKEVKEHITHKMKIAKDFESEGKTLHALQVYKKLIDIYPTYTKAYVNLADLYERLGKFNHAVGLLKSFLSIDPYNYEIRMQLGQYLMKKGKWNEASDVLDFLSAKGDPKASFFLGFINYKQENFEIAKMNFLNFIRCEKEPEILMEAFFYLAKIEIELSDFESALAFAKKAKVLYDNFWELNLITAISYFHLGMYTHAATHIEKAKKLNPKEASLREWAGKIYLKTHEFLKAEENFLKYIELKESASSELYADLGEACLNAKKAEAALAYYEIALRLDPGNQSAQAGKKNAVLAVENNKTNNDE